MVFEEHLARDEIEYHAASSGSDFGEHRMPARETNQANMASSKIRKAIPFMTANSINKRLRVFLLVVLKTQVVLAQKLKIVAKAKAIALAKTDLATSSVIGRKCSAIAKMVQLMAVLISPTIVNLANC